MCHNRAASKTRGCDMCSPSAAHRLRKDANEGRIRFTSFPQVQRAVIMRSTITWLGGQRGRTVMWCTTCPACMHGSSTAGNAVVCRRFVSKKINQKDTSEARGTLASIETRGRDPDPYLPISVAVLPAGTGQRFLESNDTAVLFCSTPVCSSTQHLPALPARGALARRAGSAAARA